MHWPQIVWIGLVCLGVGVSLAKDGEPKTGNHNFVADCAGYALGLTLLYFGGFFG